MARLENSMKNLKEDAKEITKPLDEIEESVMGPLKTIRGIVPQLEEDTRVNLMETLQGNPRTR